MEQVFVATRDVQTVDDDYTRDLENILIVCIFIKS